MKATKQALAALMANAHAESSGFKKKSENMNYRSEDRIRQIFKSARSIADLTPYIGNSKALANLVYNGRMGNKPNSDDGWIFRGAGYMQLTGRDNFKKFAEWYLGDKCLADNCANEARTNKGVAMLTVIYYAEKHLLPYLMDDEEAFAKITKAVNANLHLIDGEMARRKRYYETYLSYMASGHYDLDKKTIIFFADMYRQN